MLNERYRYDGKPVSDLNTLQRAMKRQIDSKVREGIYRFESVPCCVCNSHEFEVLSQKDRYGLYMPVVICRTCGLIQTNPRMNEASYDEFYNFEYRKLYGAGNRAYSTAEGFFEGQYNKKGPKIYNYLINANLLSKKPSEVLIVEVGCGAGGILYFFKKLGYKVKGVDLGSEFLEYGKSKYELDLSVGTLADLHLDRKPDIIIYRHVFEHILNLVDELAMIKSIIAEDGFVYIEVPGVKNLRNSYNQDFLLLLQNAHTYHFSLTSLRNLFEKNGFKLLMGNENIESIFVKNHLSSSQNKIINDYNEVMQYLQDIENRRALESINSSKPRLISTKKLKSIFAKFIR